MIPWHVQQTYFLPALPAFLPAASRTAVLLALVMTVLAAPRAFAKPSVYSAAEPLLDVHPGALAGYSLRQLSSLYAGPAVRVRRATDNMETDIGFDASGLLDTTALKLFCGFSECRVGTWYSQVTGVPDAVQTATTLQPFIVENGRVVRDEGGFVSMRFIHIDHATPSTHFLINGMTAYNSQNVTALAVADYIDNESSAWQSLVVLQTPGQPSHSATRIQLGREGGGLIAAGDGSTATSFVDFRLGLYRATYTLLAQTDTIAAFRNHEIKKRGIHTRAAYQATGFAIGGDTKGGSGNFHGTISEVVLYPALAETQRLAVYRNINAAWQTGPDSFYTNTLFPQDWQYQVDLYEWLKTVTIGDVTLPIGTIQWDGTHTNIDELADLWLLMQSASAPSRVTMAQPRWYVLDDGAGGGIEASGEVRLMHTTGHGESKSWANEPAFWYHLSIPLAGGGQGNPYYKHAALAHRALVLAAVDMIMYARLVEENQSFRRNDQYGKALLAWAEAYHWTKDILDSSTKTAFEQGFEHFLGLTLKWGAHDVNTNMDMFFVQAAAQIYETTEQQIIRDKAIRAVKKVLFGFEDGELGTHHDVLEGTIFPAGYIGEADGPETTYNGVSFYHIMGAWARVHDEPDWAFLEEVVRRMIEFKVYQYFTDPRGISGHAYTTGPAGYANRTAESLVRDQDAANVWRDLSAAYFFPEGHPLIRDYVFPNNPPLPAANELAVDITRKISTITNSGWGTTYVGAAPVWNGWEPWVKENTYLPPSGWYSELRSLADRNDPTTFAPFNRDGLYFSKAFGGEPTGTEFWVYKGNDGEQDFGFFVEADAQQGTYSGWYGGKLEAFWTEATGMLILNRHDKTGCNEMDKENTTCWDQIDTWGAHHVWGRDEASKGFSTAQIRGRELARTSTVDASAAVPYAEIVNFFNDTPSEGKKGEETGGELGGYVQITNRFEAVPDGIRVTHTLVSDAADQVTELWATLPVYLRTNHSEQGGQALLPDATIEYWNGAGWTALGTELVSTSQLRLGRDFLDGQGPRYGYIVFQDEAGQAQERRVKLSAQVWEQSYQGYARIRNVHIDLHGAPGTTLNLPSATEVRYLITASSAYATPGAFGHRVTLNEGWNLVSLPLVLENADLRALFGGDGPVALVKNEAGQVYDPALGVNEIGIWDPQEAYLVYAHADTAFTVAGAPLGATQRSITLHSGWNLVPYLGSDAQAVEEALEAILPNVLLVKDGTGAVFHPQQDIDGLGALQPRHAYWVYVKEAATLAFP